jgi:hypothetical protein
VSIHLERDRLPGAAWQATRDRRRPLGFTKLLIPQCLSVIQRTIEAGNDELSGTRHRLAGRGGAVHRYDPTLWWRDNQEKSL